MDLTLDNTQRLSNWIKNEARIQEPELYINLGICDFVNTDLVLRCPACFEVPRFPLIFPCGHLECHICYLCDFKMRSLRRGRSFVIKEYLRLSQFRTRVCPLRVRRSVH